MWLNRINHIRMTRRAEYFACKYGVPMHRVVSILPIIDKYKWMPEEKRFRKACLEYAVIEAHLVVMPFIVMGQI